jgi:hypothetical protein
MPINSGTGIAMAWTPFLYLSVGRCTEKAFANP